MKMKRFIAIAISLMMVLATSVAAFATPGPTGPGTVTVTNPREGDTYDFYRILDLNYVSSPESYSYTINAEWEAFFAAVTPALATIPAPLPNAGKVSPAAAYDYIVLQMEGKDQVGTPAGQYTQADYDAYVAEHGTAPTWNVGDTHPASADYQAAIAARPADFARELASYAKANSISPEASVNAAPWQATVPYGWYLMIPSGDDTVAVFSLDTVKPNVEITNKSSYPTITKTVTDSDETNVATDIAGVGDELVFTLTSVVPKRDGYTAYTFRFVDTMTNLTYVANSCVLTVGGNTVELAASDVTWNPTTKILTVNVPNMLTYKDGDAIVLTYKAVVDDTAVIGNSGNPNSATIVFSNDPTDTTSTDQLPPVETRTYILQIDLHKVTKDGVALAGSQWRLEKLVGSDWVAVDISGTAVTPTANQTAVSNGRALFDASGDPLFVWSGLDEGTYRLIETQAPAGYTIIEEPIQFVIDGTTNTTDGLTVLTFNCTNSYIQGTPTATASTGTIDFNVKNLTQAQLPGTGGIGVGILVAAAALGLGGFGAVALKKKKDEKED